MSKFIIKKVIQTFSLLLIRVYNVAFKFENR